MGQYKDIGILYLSVLNVSMLQWYTYKLWTVMRLCLFKNGLVLYALPHSVFGKLFVLRLVLLTKDIFLCFQKECGYIFFGF